MTDNKDSGSTDSFREKSRRDRTQVRQQIDEVRQQIEDLSNSSKDNKANIEACKGELEVLKKELQSIKEGGHTTFAMAKQMLEPKKDISSKNRSIKFRREKLSLQIAKLEAQLKDHNLSPEEEQSILDKISSFKEDRATLSQERQALKEFNHTRFMAFHKEADKANEQEAELENVDKKIFDVETRLDKALEKNDEDLLCEAKEELHLLHMEKESIANFSHDLFLKNLDQLKAKHKSDLK
jgi:chromosome segregation ATPase